MLRESHILLASIFIAGLCSIIYELLIATTSAYFLGDSITQFSLTIGVYMAFMGLGSFGSKWVSDSLLLPQFIGFELALALIGGACVPLMYFCYAQGIHLQVVALSLTGIIGVLVGLEIPLLSRLMERHYTLKANLANVLSIDYFGALIATLLFPFLLLPTLGVFKTSLAFGLMNLSIAFGLLWYFKQQFNELHRRLLRTALTLTTILLIGLLLFSRELNTQWNNAVYEDRVIHSQQSQYQQLVMTRHKDDIRLYLNGNLQFSSIDEYRYHESLIHPAMSRLPQAKNVLVLGGGDGLGVRELLKYPQLNSITVVDLDPAVAALAKNNVYIKQLNSDAFSHDKVELVHDDAFVFIDNTTSLYDVIIVDLPDPKTVSLARLYSQQFYHKAKQRLTPHGILVTQATSPFFATKAFWSIHHTIASLGFHSVVPYHVDIPSFGDWGFVMACTKRCEATDKLAFDTRFYTPALEPALRSFSADITDTAVEVSRLDTPKVLYYYLDGWKYWN